MRALGLAIAALAIGCTDFQFAENLKCSAGGNCPSGFFCDTSGDVCRPDLPDCGNNAVDPSEVCDDGNRVSGDGCRADCLKAEVCGDGVLDIGEGCDEGANTDTGSCLPACVLATCGDGFIQAGVETCDDGPVNSNTGACLATCVPASCGDGLVYPAQEACDDGAANGDAAGCTSSCVAATCGDALVHAGVEQCDDGNDLQTDGCLDSCEQQRCGDGFVHVGDELCDDGNLQDGDACNNNCSTSKVIQVVSGGLHTCVLRTSGKVRCWGAGSTGQLGYADVADVGDDEIPAKSGDIDVGGKVVQIAAGGAHVCALLDSGAVRCWGAAAFGQLGYGNTNRIGDNEHPASVGNVNVGGTVTQIATGQDHSCALLDTGSVRCWGSGAFGRLGYSSTENVGDDETPASVGNVDIGGTAIQIATGARHTCALLDSGKVRCWGSGLDGRLGYGNTQNIGDDEPPSSAGDVDLPAPVVQIAAGGLHTCAVLESGSVRCWGFGGDGQLGLGNSTSIGDNETPASSQDTNVGGASVRIVAGERHTCALRSTGGLRCWGSGLDGRLGYGNTTAIGDTELPTTAGDVATGGLVVQAATGDRHTCALLVTGGVRCWGFGLSGRLGYGNVVSVGDVLTPGSAGDVVVGVAALEIASGSLHTCALLDTEKVRCWGAGANGRLGNASTQNIGDNEILALSPDVDLGGLAKQIAVGTHHSCALLKSGSVRCWGLGSNGRLGYANTTDVGDNESPASAGDVPIGAIATAVVAAGAHSCARLETGAVRCWGLGAEGRLGYGNTNDIGDNEAPLGAGNVTVGGTVVQLVAGGGERSGLFVGLVQRGHTCALLDTGTVRCWGQADVGQLGYGNTNAIGDTEAPASAGNVNVGGVVTQVAAGTEHTCARLASGTVRCWGSAGASASATGRLGYANGNFIGDNEAPATAGDVNVGGSVVTIAAGGTHTCAVLSAGRVRCWGTGFNGRLGYGSTNNIGDNETPAAAGDVAVGGSVVQLALGGDIVFPPAGGPGACNPAPGPCDSPSPGHTCALLVNGSVRCWGAGSVGQLGYGNVNDVGDNETPVTVGNVPL